MGNKLTPEQIDSILKKNGQATTADIAELDVSLDEVDNFGDRESMREMFTDMANYNRMIREKITFINDPLTTVIPFTRENLYLICAYSGNGKSTIAANISYPLWKQDKKVLVIANEESKQDVLFRIGCLELGLSFNDYKKGRMPLDKQAEVAKLFPFIAQKIKVLDVNYKGGLTTKVEGVKSALNAVVDADYSCILIDYYQLIKFSVEKPQAKTYDVLNDFRIWLGQYIKKSNAPVVVFAQLHSIGKRANKDLDSRIKHCADIYEPSTVVIEVVPNFEERTSAWLIHKDRFGFAGQKIVCGFENGRYVKLTEEFKRDIAEKKLDRLQGKIAEEKEDDPDKS
jgi:hypothetical protein